MGKVTTAFPSEDGLVRRVKLMYCLPSGTKQEVERPVQRLILLLAAEESTVAPECPGSISQSINYHQARINESTVNKSRRPPIEC